MSDFAPSSDLPSAAAELFKTADAMLPGGGLGGYALAGDLRFVFCRGEGDKFWDAAGREWTDYACGAGR